MPLNPGSRGGPTPEVVVNPLYGEGGEFLSFPATCCRPEPRADGVRNFLAARGIELPEGADDDPPDSRTVKGLGNRKNDLVLDGLKTKGVAVYAGAVTLVKALLSGGVPIAVVSASCRHPHRRPRRQGTPRGRQAGARQLP